MQNKDIIILILLISLIYLFYCKNKKENFTEGDVTTSSTVINKDITLEEIKNLIKKEVNSVVVAKDNTSITESIKNLGIIAKKINTDNFLSVPSNFNVLGNALAVSVGTIIIWGKEEPPYPNSINHSYFEISKEPDAFSTEIYWAPCDGNIYNGIQTPDLRNRFPLGQGNWGVELNKPTGGNVPIRDHRHPMYHNHNLCFYNDDYNGWGGVYHPDINPQGKEGRGLEGDCNGDNCRQTCINVNSKGYEGKMTGHADDVNSLEPKASPYRMDKYNKDTVPHSSIVQYWIRVR